MEMSRCVIPATLSEQRVAELKMKLRRVGGAAECVAQNSFRFSQLASGDERHPVIADCDG